MNPYMLIGPTSIATRHTSSLKRLPAEGRRFGGQVKCRSFVSLSISFLKTFARLRARRFAPAMPTPTSFSFTFPAYLTCPSSLAPL